MTLSAWFSLFMISVLGAISPGPSLVVVVRNTLGGTRMSGILTAWAHALGIGVYAALSLLGLAIVLKKEPLLFLTISYAGAFYLLWLGVNSISNRGGIAATLKKGEQKGYWQCMQDGMLISVLNPKIGLFFLALFSQFIHDEFAKSGKIITVLTPFLTDGMWYTIIALTVSQPNILLFLQKKSVWIDRLMGVVLIALSLRIFFGIN